MLQLKNQNGKLLVYTSSTKQTESRLQSISAAARRIAKLLELPLEVVTFTQEFAHIYVYYKNGDEEPIPIYCDKGRKSDVQKTFKALRSMMFVLSFHPKHSALKPIQKGIIRFS